MDTLKCPSISERIKKMWYIYNGILFHHFKKNETFVTTWMDLKAIMLSEISQRKINSAWHHLYMESKTKQSKSNS